MPLRFKMDSLVLSGELVLSFMRLHHLFLLLIRSLLWLNILLAAVSASWLEHIFKYNVNTRASMSKNVSNMCFVCIRFADSVSSRMRNQLALLVEHWKICGSV